MVLVKICLNRGNQDIYCMNLAKPSTYHCMRASVGLDNELFEVPLQHACTAEAYREGQACASAETNTLLDLFR